MADHDGAIPEAERTIDFYGDPITVAVMPDAEVYVPVRPIAELLGLDWSSQLQRIRRDEVLTRRAATLVMTTTDQSRREMVCLPLDLLPGWLFGISPSRVRPDLAPKLHRYREECFRVLWRAFQADALTAIGAGERSGPTSTSLVHIRDLGIAIAQMAEQQLALEQRVSTQAERLDKAAQVMRAFDRRLGALEDQLHPSAYLTDTQAADIAAAVKALAELLTTQDRSKNHYQGVFAEIYRRFRVSSYKHLRQDQYAAVLAFLADWSTVAQGPDQLSPGSA
ncbi:MAG TPA: phage antirepressor N-terminal domain-containing protein [Herpetosiphonaceae bacterium]